jgi:hypothetical protein
MTSGVGERAHILGKLMLIGAFAGACGSAAKPAPSAPPEPAPPAEAQPAAAPAPAAPADMENEAAPREEKAPRERDEDRAAPSSAYAWHGQDDLKNAEAELERARVEFNQALAVPAPRSASGAGAPSAAGRRAADAEDPAKDQKKSEGSSCPTACHAFSSLDRAATAVCRITGEKDGRCSHAHAVVADAKKRVAACPCTNE